MTLAEQLQQLIDDLQHHLNALQNGLLNTLKNIQTGTSLTYIDHAAFTDIVCFYFEYEYDYLDIAGWTAGAKQNLITGTFFLSPNNTTDKQSDRWTHLLPESIYNAQTRLQEEYIDEADKWDEYQNRKDEVLTTWFRESWSKATAETGTSHDGYFSIHDTYRRTDLKDGKRLNDGEITKRYL